MNKRIVLPLLLVAFVVSDASAQNRFHRRRGALIGGIAGAAIGAAIGDKNNHAAGGAVIGGITGAVAGGAIGARKDQRIESRQYYSQPTPAAGPSYYQPYVYQHPTAQPPVYVDGQANRYADQPVTTPVSTSEVLTMVRRGLPESTIVQQIRMNGVQTRLQVADIIALHEQGISEPIISAIQTAPLVPQSMSMTAPPAYESGPQHADPYGESILESGAGPRSPVPPAEPRPWNLTPAN